MDNTTATKNVRRYNYFTSAYNTNLIHLRNPFVTAWWSASFPGFGHIHLGIHVISSFEHSVFLELALIQLQEKGIEKENIVVVPLDHRKEQPKLLDTIHRSDGVSLFDLAAILGTVFSVLGASYGFVLTWGPIIWGILGLAIGAIIGFIIDYWLTKKRTTIKTNLNTEVILIVSCDKKEYETVKSILFENMAIGVGELEN